MNQSKSAIELRNRRGAYLTLEEAAKPVPELRKNTLTQALHRSGIRILRDPRDRRKGFVRFSDLPEPWRGAVLERLTAEAAAEDSASASPLQPALRFPSEPSEISLLAPPGKHHELVMQRLRLVDCLIHEHWRDCDRSLLPGQEFATDRDFVAAISEQWGKGFSVGTIYAMKRKAWAVFNDSSIPSQRQWQEIARRVTPKARPGRSNHSFYAFQAEMLDKLTELFRHKAGHSALRAHQMLRETLSADEPQPTLRQSRTALAHLRVTDKLRSREEVKAAVGYVDRHYNDEFSGDAWCIDEWELDGCFYDEENHARVINYGEGRPIAHILSVIDEQSTYIMDWMLTWKVSLEEGTLTLAERLLRKFWTPLRLVSDRAGRFRRLARGRVTVGFDGDLIELLAGPLGDLGVKPRLTKEANPRGNRIERAAHREYARRATEFGISWRGANTLQRKWTEIDERVKRHLSAHCKFGICGPQLISIQQGEEIIAKWINDLNISKTKAKGCKGLTRLAAFNWFRPSEEEIARRKPSEGLVDLAFAERDRRTIQAGAVIQLSDGRRYSGVGLIDWIGARVEVVRFRRDPSFLQVFPPGQEAPVLAHLRRAVGTNEPVALSEELARLEHNRKVIVHEEKLFPMEAARETTQDPRPERQSAGRTRQMTSEEVAEAMSKEFQEGQQ